MKLSWADVSKRIGGRYAISARIFLFGSPFWVLGFFFNEAATYSSDRNALLMLGLTLSAQVAMGLVLWAAHLTVARNRRTTPVSIWVMVMVWSLSALARMAVLFYGMAWFGLADNIPIEIRMTTSIAMAVVGYGLGAYAFDAFDRYREERAQLLSKLLDEEELLSRHRDAIDAMQIALVTEVDKQLTDSQHESLAALSRLESSLNSAEQSKPAIAELRQLSDSTWQRISQELWSKAPQRAPRVKGTELITLWARSRPFSVWLLSVVAGFLFVLVYSRVFGPLFGAVITITWLGLSVLFSLIANTVLARLRLLTSAVFVVFLLMLMFSSIPLLFLFSAIGWETTEWTRAIAVHAIAVSLSFIVGLPPAVARSRENVLDALRKHLSESNLEKLHVESRMAIVSQKIANRLHGDLRGNFLASMLNLQSHLDRGDVDQARATITDIKRLLSQPMSVGGSAQSEEEDLNTFLKNWSAIVDVTMDKPLSALPSGAQSAARTVIIDAVNNAVRHGEADWIRIETRVEDDALVLTIRNNGNPLSGDREGIGTANLNALAPNNWSRIPLSGGITQLTARLELAGSSLRR